ncbi:hypothetical protein COCNU_01G013890 [Cocos nucifera]|uniref:Uncharacterized protein n=1 Tax=Cocos nucifera TaxID=13894 RepID=A0A8K0HWF4_COCNU|nr:hypothetical protein COCNU_01G013890 [Cocos nucifera]
MNAERRKIEERMHPMGKKRKKAKTEKKIRVKRSDGRKRRQRRRVADSLQACKEFWLRCGGMRVKWVVSRILREKRRQGGWIKDGFGPG